MHSKIDPSKMAAGVVLQARRLCRLRRESFLRFEGEAQIVGGVLELAADLRFERRRDGQAFPTTERHRV